MKPTLRVLVVDDNAEDRAAMRHHLARDAALHHVVDEAISGQGALEACRRTSYDVLLLDQNMPGMDGLAVLKALRALPTWGGAVVACTSTGQPDIARRALEAGATDFLNKEDLSPSLLSRTLGNALIKRRLEVQLQHAQRRTSQLQVLAEGLSRVARAQQMVPLIVEQSVKALGAAAGYVAMATEDGSHFRFEASLPLDLLGDHTGHQFSVDEPVPAAACLRTGALFTFETVAERERQFPALVPLMRAFAGLAIVPLQGGKRMIGAMGLLFGDAHLFSDEEREHLKLVGRLCGQALERAALHDEAQAARETASLSVDRYRALVSASAQIIWRAAPTGEFTTISGNWLELTGLEATVANGFGWVSSIHPEDRAAYVAESNRGFAAGSPFAVEVRLKARDGGYRWFTVQAAPVYDQPGKIREWIGASTDFTARKEADEALRREREQFRLSTRHFELALESSQVVVFNQDLDLRYTWIHNPALGLRADEVVGKLDVELFERTADAEMTERLKREVIRTGLGHREPVVIQTKGQACHYDLVIEPLYDAAQNIAGVTCVAVDISERTRLEERLADNKRQLRLALAASSTGIWSWNVTTDEADWSPECYQLHGLAPDEFEGTGAHLFRLVHEDDRARVVAAVRAAIDTGTLYQCEFRVARPDGRVVWVESVGRTEQVTLGGSDRWFDSQGITEAPQGRPIRMLGTVRDITAQRSAEAEVLSALKRTEEAVHARDQLVALVSHDLKNPLTAMSIGVDFLRRQLDAEQSLPREKVLSTLQRLWRQTRRMDRLLDELLDVARLHAGKSLELDLQPMDLSALVKSLVEEHEQISPDHHFELNVTAGPVLGTWDSKRLERVINNLVSNAVKYSPGGGVVRVELEPATAPGQDAFVRVKDSGVGIAPADLTRIFDWYARGDSALHQTIHGVGIGLAGARQIVNEHGGAISVESEVGRGSTFTVRLPTGLPVS